MAREKAKPARKKRHYKTLVRGADGGLYLLTDKDLAPFKLPEENAGKVTQILKDTQENPVVAKLSARAHREMDFAKSINCPKTCVSGGLMINTVRKK
jgi:hypothetical protein